MHIHHRKIHCRLSNGKSIVDIGCTPWAMGSMHIVINVACQPAFNSSGNNNNDSYVTSMWQWVDLTCSALSTLTLCGHQNTSIYNIEFEFEFIVLIQSFPWISWWRRTFRSRRSSSTALRIKNYSVRFACCLWTEAIMFLIIVSHANHECDVHSGGGRGFTCHSGVASDFPIAICPGCCKQIDLYAFSDVSHRASGTRPTMMWESSTLLSAYGCAWMRWDISENYLFRFRFDGLCSPISPLAAWIVERRTLHEEFKLSAVYSTHTPQCISLLVGIEWVWVGNVFHLILIRANLYL